MSKRPNTLEEFERFARENGYTTNNGMVYLGTDREKAFEFVDKCKAEEFDVFCGSHEALRELQRWSVLFYGQRK